MVTSLNLKKINWRSKPIPCSWNLCTFPQPVCQGPVSGLNMLLLKNVIHIQKGFLFWGIWPLEQWKLIEKCFRQVTATVCSGTSDKLDDPQLEYWDFAARAGVWIGIPAHISVCRGRLSDWTVEGMNCNTWKTNTTQKVELKLLLGWAGAAEYRAGKMNPVFIWVSLRWGFAGSLAGSSYCCLLFHKPGEY